MSKEYIDREWLEKRMNKRLEYLRKKYGHYDHYTDGYDEAVDAVEDAPAADVVPVVRCKDCKHSRPINKTRPPEKYFKDDCVVCECEDVVGDEPTVYVPYHFCSYGERKQS